MKTEHLWQVLFILVGALASAFAGYWFGNQPDSSAIIEYRKDSNDNLHHLMGGTDELKITYGENSLEALSNASYLIANTSNKNLDKIKIYFDLKDKTILPIFHKVSPPKNYPQEAITLISKTNGVYIFELEYLNRTESIWDGIGFSFYFGGNEAPNINVKTGTKGVSIQQFSTQGLTPTKLIVGMFKKLWWFLLIYMILGYFLFKFRRVEKREKQSMLRQAISLELESNTDREKCDVVESIIASTTKSPSFIMVVKSMFTKNT